MTTTEADLVKGLHAWPRRSYEDMDLNRLAVLAIGELRGRGISLSFENIVVALYRMFPQRFALAGYEYPDANRVNRALLQLGPKYRSWARGSPRTGYALTPLGEQVLSATARPQSEEINSASTRPARGRRDRYTWDAREDIEELRATESFLRFQSGGDTAVTDDDVWNALHAFPYTPHSAVRRRFVDLKAYARLAGDREAGDFIDTLRQRFERQVEARKHGGRRG